MREKTVYNVLLILSPDSSRILMCKRRKSPYKGLLNLIGGKVELGEDGLAAAYREMEEESGIAAKEICLTHMMDFTYHLSGICLEVYAGRLRREIAVRGEENALLWVNMDDNFFDMRRFAGEGNIGHMIEQLKFFRERILEP